MKIKHILHEVMTPDTLRTIVESEYFKINIEPYIKSGADADSIPLLYHGSHSISEDGIYDIKPRGVPKDSNVMFHNTINQFAKKELGENIRNMFFVSRTPMIAKNYGDVTMVVPIDSYMMFYSSEYTDMYIELDTSLSVFKFARKEGMREVLKSDDVTERLKLIVSYFEKPTKNSQIVIFNNLFKHLSAMINRFKFGEGGIDVTEYDTISDIVKLKESDGTANIQAIRNVMLKSLEDLYGVSNISDSENYDAIVDSLWHVAEKILNVILDEDIKLIKTISREYVSTIKRTKRLDSIMSGHEIMSTPGRYFIFTNVENTLNEIIEYYKKST